MMSSTAAEAGQTKPQVIFNDLYSDHEPKDGSLSSFFHFSKFPSEIKFGIWKCALHTHRLMVLQVSENYMGEILGSTEYYTTTNALGNIISGKTYFSKIQTNHRPSPILQVNRESRQAALQFYRIHMPTSFGSKEKPTCLFLNPEFDFLQFEIDGSAETLTDFIHDMKAHDPIGRGLLNIVIGDSPNEMNLPNNPSLLHPLALKSFTSTLTNLHSVFFQTIVNTDTRHMFCSLNMGAVHFNRSMPLHSHNESFSLLTTDPRPIEEDLEKVSLGWDPRYMLYYWRKMETAFNIIPTRPVKFKYMITAPTYTLPHPTKVLTRKDAVKFLDFERMQWEERFEEGGIYQKMGGYKNPDTPESLAKAPLSVFGFWLFPLEALGGEIVITDEEKERAMTRTRMMRLHRNSDDIMKYYPWDMKSVVDLRGFRPGVGMFKLPTNERD